MKTLFLISTLMFGYTNINAQQNYLAYLEKVEFKTLNNLKNSPKSSFKEGKKNVVEYAPSKTVSELQKDISDFNLKTETIYDETEKSTYQVVFKNGKSKAIVMYNNDGVIVSSKEIYKNIKIPFNLRVKISKKYSGWEFHKNKYSISYSKNKSVQNLFKIQIKKGNQSKTLTFNKT